MISSDQQGTVPPLHRLFVYAFAVGLSMNVAAIAGVIAGFTVPAQASHDRHDIYSSGFVTIPVRNTSASFLAAGYDLTGVGFMSNNGSQAVTMISPQHFVMAAHYPPSTKTVRFVTASNQVRSYNIDSTAVLPTPRFNGVTLNHESDVLIGRLTAPIPPEHGIGYFPIADDPNLNLIDGPIPPINRFRSARLLCQGFNGAYPAPNGFTSPHIGANILSQGPFLSTDVPGLSTVTFGYVFDSTVPTDFHSIDGDSGSPSFIPVDGRLALVGLHYDLLANDTSIDSFLPFYVGPMSAFMNPDGEKVRLLTVPRKNEGLPGRRPFP